MRDAFAALVACGQSVAARAGARRRRGTAIQLLDRGDDWEALFALARSHGMLPLLLEAIGDEPELQLPRDVPERVATLGRECAVRSLAATRQLAATMQLLHHRSIPVLAFKGPALSVAAYGIPTLRSSDDLDIVVSPAHLDAAAAVLGAAGYHPQSGLSWRQARVTHDWQGHVPLVSASDPLPVELHWRFCDRKLPWNPDVTGVLERATRASIGGVSVQIPDRADQIVLVLTHAARHGWDRLESLVCVAALLAPGVDGAALLRAARRARAWRVTLAGLASVQRLLGAVLPIEVTSEFARDESLTGIGDMILERVRAGDAGDARDRSLHMAMLDGRGARARYLLLAAILPTPRDVAVRARGPWLLGVPVRLARLAVRALRGGHSGSQRLD